MQALNPFLPCHEYIPDGEPHVFDNRLYLFGSHDAFNGTRFCQNDYVCWSAPVEDLSAWHYHGVSYRKAQDPYGLANRALYAPDVARGRDGRYYLFYTLDFWGLLGVAVAPCPAGPYQFLGHVRTQDGHLLGQRAGDVLPYDPGVFVDDDGQVHLYLGVAAQTGPLAKRLAGCPQRVDGCYHFTLADDMLTLTSPGEQVLPGSPAADTTDFAAHPFFEASSLRKIGQKYYLIYSSIHSHELCYALADRPEGPFTFGGVIISIGDIGLNGRIRDEQAANPLGTTHGSLACVGGQWYVFYHRHTNDNQLSRQACAEKIHPLANGYIPQAEVTSCGLNPGWLAGRGRYPAYMACGLTGPTGAVRYQSFVGNKTGLPYFTQDQPDNDLFSQQYITGFTPGSVAVYKYFDMQGASRIAVEYRGQVTGQLYLYTAPQTPPVARLPLQPSTDWATTTAPLAPLWGQTALYIGFEGTGAADLLAFTLA